MFTILTTTDDKLLTKRITKADGQWVKADYDRAFTFDAFPISVHDIVELSEALTMLEGEATRCIVRGQPVGSLTNIRRTLYGDDQGDATLEASPSGLPWLMLDFDKIPVGSLNLATNEARLDHLVSMLPPCFHSVSYHYQWSASAGLDGWNFLSCHLFYWLSERWFCRTLYERFADGDFKDAGVDPACFTVNQIHYTAAPIFEGCADPLVGLRSGLVRGDRDAVSLPTWRKPAPVRPLLSPRDEHERFPLVRFRALLDEIGPDYHRRILKAVAHYCAIVKAAEYDREWLIDELQTAIVVAPEGKNNKRDYLDRRYLERVIGGAERKFGGSF